MHDLCPVRHKKTAPRPVVAVHPRLPAGLGGRRQRHGQGHDMAPLAAGPGTRPFPSGTHRAAASGRSKVSDVEFAGTPAALPQRLPRVLPARAPPRPGPRRRQRGPPPGALVEGAWRTALGGAPGEDVRRTPGDSRAPPSPGRTTPRPLSQTALAPRQAARGPRHPCVLRCATAGTSRCLFQPPPSFRHGPHASGRPWQRRRGRRHVSRGRGVPRPPGVRA